jgi:sulfur-oxidizing protein SoxY
MEMSTKRNYQAAIDRRHALKIAAAGTLTFLGVGALTRAANATAESAAAEMNKLTNGAKILPAPAAALKVTLPEIAEDGSQVQITIVAEKTMPDGGAVRTVHVIAQDNPQPLVVSFTLSPLLAKNSITTRVRLAQTEDVIVLVVTDKGTPYTFRKNVKVTIGGCGG